jgi:dTDP-4-amino-4,6-dideoxygalactose transaminase
MDTMQAAVLCVKLPRLDSWNAARQRAAATFGRLLSGLPVTTPAVLDGAEHTYHLYVIRLKDREALQEHLQDAGVATGLHYPIPIHLQPAYQELGYNRGHFPITEAHAGKILSLPIFPELDDEKVAYIADTIRSFFDGKGVMWTGGQF